MDEKMEKIISLTNNEGRYQIFAEMFVVLLWINCNFITVSLTFFGHTSLVSYYDASEGETVAETLDYDICDEEDYEILESYDYSLVTDYDIECDSLKTGLIGTMVYHLVIFILVVYRRNNCPTNFRDCM